MNSREGVRISRRYQLRLSQPLSAEVEAFAVQRGLALCQAIRLLVAHGLESNTRQAGQSPDSLADLAALTAAEHAVLMVASVLPEGQRRMHELAPQAAIAAEERLAQFKESGQ
jgi:hypothetical protein